MTFRTFPLPPNTEEHKALSKQTKKEKNIFQPPPNTFRSVGVKQPLKVKEIVVAHEGGDLTIEIYFFSLN